MAKQKSPKQFSDYPAIREAEEKAAELHHRRQELQARIREVGRAPASNETDVSRAADELLGGGVVVTAPNFTELRREEEILTAAIRKQARVVDAAKAPAIREILKARQPEHEKIVAGIFQTLEALQEQLRTEQAFRDGLARQGITFQPPLCQLTVEPRDLLRVLKHLNLDLSRRKMRAGGYKV